MSPQCHDPDDVVADALRVEADAEPAPVCHEPGLHGSHAYVRGWALNALRGQVDQKRCMRNALDREIAGLMVDIAVLEGRTCACVAFR